MKRVTLWIMALVALHGAALEAQNLTGNWQGTLELPQRKIRVVFKIALANDKLQATAYTVDQPSPPILATITRDGPTIKITGRFSQGPQVTLNLARATPETAWAIPEPPPPPNRMAPDAKPAFEVATIKPSDPAHPQQIITLRGAEVITTNVTVHALINLAYWLHPKQLAGGPAWTETEKFDMAGKPDVPGQPNVDQMKMMIQKVLTDRFQLQFHFEKRELPVYAVRLAKTGAKLTPSQDDPKGIPGWNFGRNPAGMIMSFRNSPLSQFTAVLQNSTDRPVVDQSGLTGRYDFTLNFTPDAAMVVRLGGPPTLAGDNPDAAPDLFAAFQQQLGLKLEPAKAPVDVMVIDKVERPSEN